MSPTSQRSLGATLIALIALGYAPTVSSAVPVPVFTESFETCTIPDGDPSFSAYGTATASANPIYVNLWTSDILECPGWEADGEAWLTQHDYGGSFPDGDLAAWLNEGENEGTPAGSITRDITGLTEGNDYTLSLETWIDDRNFPTTLTVNVTNGSDVQTYELDLAAGQGIQAFSEEFSATDDTVTLELIGARTDDLASPLVDNIRITNAGPTPEDPGSRPTNNELATTGYSPASLLSLSGLFLAAGLGAIALGRRFTRRNK